MDGIVTLMMEIIYQLENCPLYIHSVIKTIMWVENFKSKLLMERYIQGSLIMETLLYSHQIKFTELKNLKVEREQRLLGGITDRG